MNTGSIARSLLIRGMIAGLLAGFVAFGVAHLFGESQVNAAISVEEAAAASAPAADGHSHDEEEGGISRGVQSGIGLLTATTLYGVGLGGIFALVFAGTLGRLGAFGARTLSGLLALGAFAAVYAVPFLKYPPNPPATGDPDTIGQRTALYFTTVAISVALGVLAVWAGRTLAPALGGWNATIAAGAGYVVLIGLCLWALPTINEVGADFPAVVLYQFRLSSFAIQLSVWVTLGLAFGALADRVLKPRPAAATVSSPVPA